VCRENSIKIRTEKAWQEKDGRRHTMHMLTPRKWISTNIKVDCKAKSLTEIRTELLNDKRVKINNQNVHISLYDFKIQGVQTDKSKREK